MNKATTEEIWQMALASGLCDADLSNDNQVFTDYGDATEAVERFAAMIATAEREACAKHFDDGPDTIIYRSEVAAAIRNMRSSDE